MSPQPALPDAEVVLDLSRLLSRILFKTPTGVDRVEMAYARCLLAVIPDRLSFAAVQPSGIYGRLGTAAVLAFLDATENRWNANEGARHGAGAMKTARTIGSLRPRRVPKRAGGRVRLYVQASPHHLEQRGRVERILKREQAKLVCLVHDLIPIEYPEYARADGAARHRARVATIAALCDGIITNSAATQRSLQRHLDAARRAPLVRVAHLGTYGVADDLPAACMPPPPAAPYFVCIGTIEPRKNHLLLLNIWRRMVEELGAAATPRLLVIGRRGWENEQVIDMLERCPAIVGHVRELHDLPDSEVRRLLRGARALLLPSFAEGYGMPVTEALALGVPVLCSDLPALREAGGAVPDFLDPLDGPAWMRAIQDLAGANSNRRAAQLQRRDGWRPQSWPEHIAILLELLHKLAP